MQPLLDNELLQKDRINATQFNTADVELPSGKGICYIGRGIQMEYNGERYEMCDDHLDIIKEALKSDEIKWYWNMDRFKKYGGTDSVTLDVHIVDKAGEFIPNLHLSILKNVTP